MVFASCCGPLGEDIPPGITLSSLQQSIYTLLGCLGLLVIALFLLGFMLRHESGGFWRRKVVVFVAVMGLLALISAVWAWFAYESLAHYGLPPSAGYLDWYERFGQDIANQLDSAVGGFGTWALLFSIATLALLGVVGEQIVTSRRVRRPR